MMIHQRRSRQTSNVSSGFLTHPPPIKRNRFGGGSIMTKSSSSYARVVFIIICSLILFALFSFQHGFLSYHEEHGDLSNERKEFLSKRTLELTESLRESFYERYGGKDDALSMLRRGILPAYLDKDRAEMGDVNMATLQTAKRIVDASTRARGRRNDEIHNSDSSFNHLDEKSFGGKFVMSFAGYSVTVGRGNLFSQSYPFVLQKILSPIFRELFDTDLVVRNMAIGGIPSFPYGWCQSNYLGVDADVVSWDYGMNEGNGAEIFEAYLRQTLVDKSKAHADYQDLEHSHETYPNRPPMMIMLDTKKSRVDLLRNYAKKGYVIDSIAVGRGEVVDKKFLNDNGNSGKADETSIPPGFQQWNEWGAPKGSPGQSPWHPKFMEHELIGWMIAIHFLDAIELAAKLLYGAKADASEVNQLTSHKNLHVNDEYKLLPDPIHSMQPRTTAEISISSLLYGMKKDQSLDHDHSSPSKGISTTEGNWEMNQLSCRTSFLPVVSGKMSSIIVSGLVQDSMLNTLEDTDDALYSSGWVVDVGKLERDTKKKVDRVNGGKGMGYIDMKLALYATPQSGTLRLWLPYEGNLDKDFNDDHASKWFRTLVFCEVNEKRGDDECKMNKDVAFIVGAVTTDSEKSLYRSEVHKITSVASYLKKEICFTVSIPPDAKITRKYDLKTYGGSPLSPKEMDNLGTSFHDDIGLTVDVNVIGKDVSRTNGACSISHVIWEQN